MRVLEFQQFGDPSVLQVAERPDPHADADTAVVRMEGASINPSDVKNVAGKMSQTTLPRVPGRDYSGVVVEGPEDWLGVEVWGTGGDAGFTRDGTHAEFILVPRTGLSRKPARLTHPEAAAVGVTFLTAWCAVVEYAALKSGETLVVLGSSGGVGGAAVQIAKHLGAPVVGVNRSRPAASPADVLLDANDPHLPAAVREVTGGLGADVVFNAAGGPMFEVGLGLLRNRGRQVEITSPTERRASLDVVDFYHHELQLFGLDTLKRNLTASARVLEKMHDAFEMGAYQPPVIAVVRPLSEAQQAYEQVAKGQRGRVVLEAMTRVSFGFQLLPVLAAPKLVEVAVRLEAMGFDHLSMPDHMLFPDGSPAPDAWMLLAAAAVRTRRITLSTSVSDPHRVHPAVLAHRVATLDQLSRGRVIVGLGAGEVMNLDPYGIPWNRPVARLKEALQIVRHLWDSPAPLDFAGDFYQLKQARLDVKPYHNRYIPIHLAAFGPVMQRLTAELADGWIPIPLPASDYGRVLASIRDKAQAFGRNAAIEGSIILPVAVTTDAQQVRRMARRFALDLVWPGILPNTSLRIQAPEAVAGVHYQTVNPCDPESLRQYYEHGRHVPDEVLEQFMIFGDIPTLRRRLGEYVDAGATRIILINASPDPTGSTLRLAVDVLPYFTRRAATWPARIGHLLAPILPRSPEEVAAVKQAMEGTRAEAPPHG